MTTDTNALMAAARCFKCIPAGMTREVMIYLLCAWAKKKVTPPPSYPCGVPSNTIKLSGAFVAEVNQNYTLQGNGTWLSADGGYFIRNDVTAWNLFPISQLAIYKSSPDQFPCVWTRVLAPNPPPTGQYV